MPQSSTLTYLAGDHLGSTSLAVDASTGDVIETRYKPWGEVRYTTQDMTLPTRYTFTGQYSYMDDEATDLGAAGFGLMFYNARWYDPALGRFAQADSIVPGGVQGLDRFAYVGNNPVVYTDPSGHAQYRSDYQNQIHAKNNAVKLPQPWPWAGTSSSSKDPGRCDEDIYGYCVNGLTPLGVEARHNLKLMGLYGNEQAALEYLVAAEFNYGIVNPNINAAGAAQNLLLQGMTNRYQTFCTSDGAWSTSCLNNFWAYHEPVLTGKSVSDAFAPYDTHGWDFSQRTIITNSASAIQHPGQPFGSGREAVTAGNADGTTTGWDGGCDTKTSANICHYAEISPTSPLWTPFTTWAYGQNMPVVDSASETYWGLGGLHVWNSYGELFFVASQAAYVTYGFPVYGQ